MSRQHEFFLARAAEARDDAHSAQLVNVRDRCLRAVEAWEGMAARAERTERSREKAEAEKAASVTAAQ